MTQKEIWNIALEQAAIDYHCAPEDFLAPEARFFVSKPDERAKRYLTLPLKLDFTTFGYNVVASGREDILEAVKEYFLAHRPEEAMSFPCVNDLNGILQPFGVQVRFMGNYFLPDVARMRTETCAYKTRVLEEKDFQNLYLPEWSNALCEKRRHLDRLCVGAYDGETLVGLAGASADGERMWQIGVDVSEPYRRQGIACAVTTRLAQEIFDRGYVPFYCCLWANAASMKNALKSHFKPAWMQMSV